MKKLYLLLANGLVLFAGVGTLTLSVAGCNHKKKGDTTTKIYDALNKFTKTSPLEIPYQTKTPTAKVSDSAITKAVKDLMKAKVPAIFTETVLDKIKFDDTPLKVNEVVAVKATYNNDQEKAVTIYIKERTIEPSLVYSELAKFTKASPLEIAYQTETPTAPVSDPAVTKAVKELMKAKVPDIFTDTVLGKIKFDETLLKVGEVVAVKATYNNDQEKAVTIYIKERTIEPSLVYSELAKFTKASPLEIAYQTETPTAPVSDPAVTKAVKELMKAKVPDIFTDTVLGKIKFDETLLKVGEVVAVKATYNDDQEKAVTIYIKEPENFDQGVYDALASFVQNNPIEIPYNQKNPTAPASNPAVTTAIKSQMKKKDPIFTDPVLAEITFSNTPLQENTAVQVQATYKEKAVTIYVKEEDNSITTLVINILKNYNAGNPVEIGVEYDGKYADDDPAWNIRAFIYLRWLRSGGTDPKIGEIISPQSKEVTLSHTQLKKGESVRVTASYGGKSATIFVKVKET